MNLRPLRPEQQQKQKPPARWSYHQNSKDFVGWVNRLGIERTWIGRLADSLNTRFKLQRLGAFFLFSLALAFMISWEFEPSFSGFKEGMILSDDIRSPFTLEVTDPTETNRRRVEAEEAVPPVYDYDAGLFDQKALNVRTAIRNMRSFTSKNEKSNPFARQADFDAELGARLSNETFGWLIKQRFNPGLESVLAQSLERWNDQKIVEDLGILHQTAHQYQRLTINIIERGFKSDEFVEDTSGLLDTSDVRKKIGATEEYPGFAKHADVVQINEILRSLVSANLVMNKTETETRKDRVNNAVTPYVLQVKKGQVLVHAGSPLQKSQVAELDELSHIQNIRHQDLASVVMAIFFVVLLLCYVGYVGRFMSKVKITGKDALAMGCILLLEVTLLKLGLFVCNTALSEHFTSVPSSFYLYLFPASFGAMMVGLIIPSGEVVWLFTIFLSIVIGLIADRSFALTIITFTSGIVAARGVYGCKKREDLYWAGIKTGVVNAILVFCITLMSRPSPELLRVYLLWNTPAAFLSGLFSAFFALTLIPFWETLFIYTTDVKLLELSNLNHPLLKELIVQAPGTYHHSLVVGSMCEAAAEAIGANPLLGKVCAYYHDIGKTDHAQYFIENQRPGENRHDHINPGMSKTILIAHVKDGVEKGIKYKLGKQIIDVIEQHHGTTLISFFYHRAKAGEDASMHEVTENEYRYPGPKPEFREAALCMLADSIEAAARSLDEPTPARLQAIVHTIVQKKFLDGQLDNCNLTLKDLTLIEEAFTRILFGIYHQRIDYPTTPKTSNKKPAVTPTTAS